MGDAWRDVTIADVAVMIKRGRAPVYAERGALVVNQRVIRDGNRLELGAARRTDVSARSIPDWAWVQTGDVLVCSTGRGTLGRAATVQACDEPLTADSHVSIVRPDTSRVDPGYLGLTLSTLQTTFERYQSGSTNQTELSPTALGSVVIPLPPPEVQRRIVDLMSAADEALANLSRERTALSTTCDALRRWVFWAIRTDANWVEFSELTQDVRRPLQIEGETEYSQIGIRSFGRGVFGKVPVKGAELGTKKMFMVKAGDLVFNVVFAWEGAVAVVPQDFDGWASSHRFPTYRRTDGGSVEFLRHFFLTPEGLNALLLASPGGAGRNRTLGRGSLARVRVPQIPEPRERQLVEALSAAERAHVAVGAELESLTSYRTRLLTAALAREVELPEAYDRLMDAGVA